jgi:hypothetical protein
LLLELPKAFFQGGDPLPIFHYGSRDGLQRVEARRSTRQFDRRAVAGSGDQEQVVGTQRRSAAEGCKRD